MELYTVTVLLVTLLSKTNSIPVESPATITVRENPNCGSRLTNLIETCLIPYERKLVVYRSPGTTDMEKYRMRSAFCHEYEVTLQCLHTVLLQCPNPPALEHLNIIERRVGYLRDFMDQTCRVPLEAMTPKPMRPPTRPSTMLTTSMKSLTTLLRSVSMDPTTPRLIIPPKSTSLLSRNKEGSTVQPTFRPKSRTTRTGNPSGNPSGNPTTYNVRVVTDKLNKLQTTQKPKYVTPTPSIEIDLKEYDKTENDITVDNVILPDIETSAIEDNKIRINNPVNCDNKLGNANNPLCSMLMAQSSSSTVQVTLLTLVTLLCSLLL